MQYCYQNHHQYIILPSKLKCVNTLRKMKCFKQSRQYYYSQHIYTTVFKISLPTWLMYFTGLYTFSLMFFRQWSNKNIVLSFLHWEKKKQVLFYSQRVFNFAALHLLFRIPPDPPHVTILPTDCLPDLITPSRQHLHNESSSNKRNLLQKV